MPDRDPLSVALYGLSQEVLELVESHDEIEPIDISIPCKKVDLDYSPSSRSMESSRETTKKTVYKTEHVELLFEELKELDSYENVIDILSDRTDHDPSFLLRQYTRSLLVESIDSINDHDIVSLVNIFTFEVDDGPINWHPIIFLVGIKVGIESFELNSDITLRQPKEEDLEYDIDRSIRSYSPFTLDVPRLERQPHTVPDSVMEFTIRTGSSEEITQIVEKYIILFRLYDIGSVTAIDRNYNPESIVPGRHWPGDKTVGYFQGFDYTIDEDDIDALSEFIDELSIPVVEQLLKTETDSTLSIAYDRYANALDEPSTKERQLTFAIMSLEALLLKEQERSELSERLSRRAGLLLDYFGLQPIEVANKLREAYRIRSQYVHGSDLDDEADISSLTEDTMEYTRRCLVTFLQLSEETKKDDILSKIDNASLHPDARDALHDLLDEKCNI